MKHRIDCKKFPIAPNMDWRLEECLKKNLTSLEEAKPLKGMTSNPSFCPELEELSAWVANSKALRESEEIRVVIGDMARKA